MNKKHYGVNIGSSSIIMIFVILCLVSFAALSIVSANSDYQLSNKIATRTSAYYEACNEAEHSIASVDAVLHELYQSSSDAEEYFLQAGTEKSFIIPISDYQSLQIDLEIIYPPNADGSFYNIISWQVIMTNDLDYDDSLNVIH